jgi:hypothetical protein
MNRRCLASTLLSLAFTASASAQDAPPSYVKDIRPFMTKYCTECHKAGNTKGGINLDSYASILKAERRNRKALVPGDPDKSRLVTTCEGTARPIMPPKNAKAKPTEKEVAMLRAWVKAGAKDDTPAEARNEGRPGVDSTALQISEAPKGRNMIAQGNALGLTIQRSDKPSRGETRGRNSLTYFALSGLTVL